ncbi:conserved hypothetical protein [Burkholderia cenocepacia HI2424]|uniref:Uncharacterized protein n=2 Tax=Burkholderia cepacia complex TaxID=87882 RepID=A0A427NKZ9_9BURK|nr:conserved hypothetical protein [Burkholderia cenocepacia HI2424]PNO73629.1 hypothetical protein DK10_021945 [Burkholderia cenocepacia]RQV27912.1 hypothetical protein DF030_04725 [Burkholderia cenocepacia]RSC03465.1 hypothetical protein EGT41_29535 [Burkholderia cenocepacia]
MCAEKMGAQAMACTNFVRMHSKLKCVRESRRQRTHARAVAAATVCGWPARRRDGLAIRHGSDEPHAPLACDSANPDAPQ